MRKAFYSSIAGKMGKHDVEIAAGAWLGLAPFEREYNQLRGEHKATVKKQTMSFYDVLDGLLGQYLTGQRSGQTSGYGNLL